MALDFVAGCLGGCAGLMMGYPLDTIKVHIQTQDHRKPKFKGTWHCFRTILARDSISGLYRGVTSPMAGVAVVNAIVFGVYGETQRSMADQDHLTTHFFAGASAGLAQSPICSPLELAKTRLQLQSSVNAVFTGPVHCLRHIYRNEGCRGVFTGLGITALREAPSYGVYFLTYELLTRTSKVTDISTFHMLMAGGLAGTASWVATYPVDVIKSRLQADGQGRYSGALDCLRQSMKTEGHKWLFRGLSSTIIRAFPTNAATFAVVTWTFRIFSDKPDSRVDGKPTNPGRGNDEVASATARQTHQQRDSFVDKCNTLVSRVMDEYNYESRSYFSPNGITLYVDDANQKTHKPDNDTKLLQAGEEARTRTGKILAIEETEHLTNNPERHEEGG
ncbi:mitochondrial basic amino acids transporter [Venturia canescens]|uniref:mitochondrial basic amino acids transporter n=1 Tax=Venturia canescens TaxID=32260 RepID=UPI001C9CD2AE|nr:mitochondrial basic amino acids transporter [Venturia canescens]